jgi:hypothetical protein
MSIAIANRNGGNLVSLIVYLTEGGNMFRIQTEDVDEWETFTTVSDLAQALANTATDEYTKTVMVWARSSDKAPLEIFNGKHIEKWVKL